MESSVEWNSRLKKTAYILTEVEKKRKSAMGKPYTEFLKRSINKAFHSYKRNISAFVRKKAETVKETESVMKGSVTSRA
jgi:hypothetical protein